MEMIKIVPFHFQDETLRNQAFAIRTKVFVEEQHVDPKLEYDEFDVTAHHYLAYYDGQVVGTARWRETNKGVKLERFAVLRSWRNKNIGREILKVILNDTSVLHKDIYLHSQVGALRFYERNGFRKQGNAFFEAGIEHYLMTYEIHSK